MLFRETVEKPMIKDFKIAVVLPAYNAAKTLRDTYREIPLDIVDDVILVDDASIDATVAVAQELGIYVQTHNRNRGYGANQKTCFAAALDRGADIVVMLHPDYQYTPKLIPAMVHLLACQEFDVVLGSRILGGEAMRRGMPVYKYISNRILTLVQNILLSSKLSEYHTGYRAFTRRVLEVLPFQQNDDDFIFDNQILTQIIYHGFRIGEVTCPARYFPEASSINFRRSLRYGFGCLWNGILFRMQKMRWIDNKLFYANSDRSTIAQAN
jgi:glycosyltransferase involved in cell wall biosynthesis